jgi:hypothetical protein
MNAESIILEAATIRQQCKLLRMPTIAAPCGPGAGRDVQKAGSPVGGGNAGHLEMAENRKRCAASTGSPA